MGVCSVFDCNNNERKKITRDSSFHKFPKGNLNLSKKWTLFTKRKDKINIRTARICSLHFLREDFINNTKYEMGFTRYRILKPDAVPTVHPKQLSKASEPGTTKRSKRMELKKQKEIVNALLEVPTELEHENVYECENDSLMENIPHPQLEQAQFDELTEQLNRKKEEQNDCAKTTSLVIARENETVNQDELLIKDEVCSNYSTTEFIIEEHEPIQSTNASQEMTKRCWNGVNEVTQTAKRKKLSDIDSRLEDALQCIKSLKNKIENRDEHAVFGEFIAHKIRTCNKNEREISIAQHHIENVLFNLTMGTYGKEVKLSSASNEITTAEESQSNELIIP